ncbi:MAG: hypothetical protein RL026_813 [Pseudomonadota bacterium]|jgi:hypothetical protein
MIKARKGGRMMKMQFVKVVQGLLVGASLLAMSSGAVAHHSRAPFRLDLKQEMKARITEVRWTNPHVFFTGTVTNAAGQAEEWTFEGHSISGQTRAGWTRDTVKPGDELLLIVNPHRDGSKRFALLDHVVFADGRRLYAVGVPPADPNAPKPPVKPSTDFSGNWKYQFPGTPEQVRQRVLLGTAAPAKDGPYTAKARAQVAAYKADDNPTLRCIPSTLPYLLMAVYEYKWIRYQDRIVIEKEQFNDSTRVIHLGKARRPPGFKPNPLGFSVGRFEADGTLVVETTGFNAAPWGNGAGIDSSERKRIVERYQLVDGGTRMKLSYTLEDPEYFTRPVTAEGMFNKAPDADFARNPPCDLKAAQQHLEFER